MSYLKVPQQTEEPTSQPPETEEQEQQFNPTQRSMSKTFFKGATSMCLGTEPTMTEPILPVNGMDSPLKKRLDLIQQLILEDEPVSNLETKRNILKIK